MYQPRCSPAAHLPTACSGSPAPRRCSALLIPTAVPDLVSGGSDPHLGSAKGHGDYASRQDTRRSHVREGGSAPILVTA